MGCVPVRMDAGSQAELPDPLGSCCFSQAGAGRTGKAVTLKAGGAPHLWTHWPRTLPCLCTGQLLQCSEHEKMSFSLLPANFGHMHPAFERPHRRQEAINAHPKKCAARRHLGCVCQRNFANAACKVFRDLQKTREKLVDQSIGIQSLSFSI